MTATATQGRQWTISVTYKPTAGTDGWYANGKLFSGAMTTFSQKTAQGYAGYKGCLQASQTTCAKLLTFNSFVKPVLTAVPANGKLWNSGAGTTTTLAATSAFTSGEVTAATSSIDMFTVAAATSELSLTVTQKVTLKTAIAS
jgi:hypothetical protein